MQARDWQTELAWALSVFCFTYRKGACSQSLLLGRCGAPKSTVFGMKGTRGGSMGS
jgi:hypothetical protein